MFVNASLGFRTKLEYKYTKEIGQNTKINEPNQLHNSR
jgi:hypothetical protein